MKKECDLCGRESSTSCIKIHTAGVGSEKRIFNVCKLCKKELGKRTIQEQNYLIDNIKYLQGNQEEINTYYGPFRLAGTVEVGGYVCPKCGFCNNAYTFKHKCRHCGYNTL